MGLFGLFNKKTLPQTQDSKEKETLKLELEKFYAIKQTSYIRGKHSVDHFKDVIEGKTKFDTITIAKYRELYSTLVQNILVNGKPNKLFDKNNAIKQVLRKMSYLNSPYTYIYNFLKEIEITKGDISKLKKVYDNKQKITKIKNSETSLDEIAFMIGNFLK